MVESSAQKMRVSKPCKSGLMGAMAKRAFLGRIENGIRQLLRVAVSYRNSLYGKSWGAVARERLLIAGYSLEERFHLDINQDGYVGDPHLGVKALPPAGGAQEVAPAPSTVATPELKVVTP